MTKGDNILITYKNQNNNTLLALFLEKNDRGYLFKNINGVFIVTKKAIDSKKITLKVIEDWYIEGLKGRWKNKNICLICYNAAWKPDQLSDSPKPVKCRG